MVEGVVIQFVCLPRKTGVLSGSRRRLGRAAIPSDTKENCLGPSESSMGPD